MQIETVGIGGSAKGVMPGKQNVDGIAQRAHLKSASEIHAEGLVEGAGCVIAEFRREEYFPLRLGHVHLKNLLEFRRDRT
jgi:hypothetical protein